MTSTASRRRVVRLGVNDSGEGESPVAEVEGVEVEGVIEEKNHSGNHGNVRTKNAKLETEMRFQYILTEGVNPW